MGYRCGPVARDFNNNYNNRRNVNVNNRLDNGLGMVSGSHLGENSNFMKTYRNLYSQLCSYENLELAFRKARKGKTLKEYVVEFESNLEENLLQLRQELENLTYSPAPLTTFVVRDPKTRKISASHFRDRVVHHALCNVIGPILEKGFIYDSFANQKGKGTHSAIKRFEKFLRKVSFNGRDEVTSGGGNANCSIAELLAMCLKQISVITSIL